MHSLFEDTLVESKEMARKYTARAKLLPGFYKFMQKHDLVDLLNLFGSKLLSAKTLAGYRMPTITLPRMRLTIHLDHYQCDSVTGGEITGIKAFRRFVADHDVVFKVNSKWADTRTERHTGQIMPVIVTEWIFRADPYRLCLSLPKYEHYRWEPSEYPPFGKGKRVRAAYNEVCIITSEQVEWNKKLPGGCKVTREESYQRGYVNVHAGFTCSNDDGEEG